MYNEHSKNRSSTHGRAFANANFFRNQGNTYHISTDTSVSIALYEFILLRNQTAFGQITTEDSSRPCILLLLIRVAGRRKKEKENFRFMQNNAIEENVSDPLLVPVFAIAVRG